MNQIERKVMDVSMQCSPIMAVFTANVLVTRRETVGSLKSEVKGIQCNLQNGLRKIQTRGTRVTSNPEITSGEMIIFPVIIVEK